MKSIKEDNFRGISFSEPAIYQIKVKGNLIGNMKEQLSGMQLTIQQSSNKESISLLIGRISDQAALIGILNALYELHLPVISVKVLNEVND